MGEKHHAYSIYGKSSKSIVCGAFYISYLAAVFSCKKKNKGQKKWNIKTLFFSPQKILYSTPAYHWKYKLPIIPKLLSGNVQN